MPKPVGNTFPDARQRKLIQDILVEQERANAVMLGIQKVSAIPVTTPAIEPEDLTQLKLLGSDFIATARDYAINDETYKTGQAFRGSGDVQVATKDIPKGYRATAVMIYGRSATQTVNVYQCKIDDESTANNLGTGFVGTQISINMDSTDTDYLTVAVGAEDDDMIYGGYIAITKI